ncbi:MAG TPA: hypothetical protein VIM07_11535 [Chitinophagaceae bacterium]
MKRILIFILISFSVYACKESVKSEPTPKTSDAKSLYEKNLASLKKGITAFENENLDEWATTVADTTIWNSAAYGSSPGTKADWRKMLAAYIADWDSLTLNYPDFLPGIDSATHEFDGSVRYYGIWNGVHKSGVHTSVNFYATYDFNKEGKIINASEFFDVGGLMNAIKAKTK